MQDFGSSPLSQAYVLSNSPSSDSTAAELGPFTGIRRRQRKSKEQLQILIKAFQLGKIWTPEQIQTLGKETGLKPAQVCKWRWDYDQKLQREAAQAQEILQCSETLHPLPLHRAFKRLQKRYEAETQDSTSPSRLLA